jgi:hypothetical protein
MSVCVYSVFVLGSGLRVLRFPLQSSFAPPITPQSPSCIIRGKCTIGQFVAAVLGLNKPRGPAKGPHQIKKIGSGLAKA